MGNKRSKKDRKNKENIVKARKDIAKKQKGQIWIIIGAIVLIFIAFFVLFLFLAKDELPKKQEFSELKIGYSKYPYPPLHYFDSENELVGFDIDLAEAAAGLIGAKIEFVPIDWAERAELLESKEVDLLWGGLERASLNEQKIKFTKSYLRSDIVLLMNDDRDYAKLEELQGLNVCTLNFTPAYYYLQVYSKDVIKSRRSFTPPNYMELMGALDEGEFDCMITDTSFASFYQRETKTNYKMSETVLGSNYAVAVRIEDTDLFDALQDALDQLEADGTIASLREKWIANP
ncbi:MAG: ABC transporter substrate-binding protein [Oscillospiraceae bacterium]|nr:ABC transporter substrate-binding protein [Oscillospiraceae bacterium]